METRRLSYIIYEKGKTEEFSCRSIAVTSIVALLSIFECHGTTRHYREHNIQTYVCLFLTLQY